MQKESKWLVGRSRKQQNLRLLNEQDMKKEVVESKRPLKYSKKKREYQNWTF
jgi:hypothetical protein